MKEQNKRIRGIAMHNPSVSIKNVTAGITLIALVITIIVLLILAGVSIATLTGSNGILTQTGEAKTNTEIAEAKERAKIDIATWISDKMSKGEDSTLNNAKIKEILTGKEYVKEVKNTSFISSKGHEINYSDLISGMPNKPEKRDNMEFIKYNEGTKEWEVVTDENSDWYSYEETTDEDMLDRWNNKWRK